MRLILIVFCLVALFFNLGQRSFWEPDEGRYAEISREMLASGDWLTPRVNYLKHFDKPPIAYWLIGGSFKLFGQNEFAGHLPIVILALAGVLVTFSLGEHLFNRRAGFLSGLILISSLGYPAIGRILSTDMVFTFFVLCAYLFFVRRSYLFFYLCLALGFMTKGPVIFVLTLLPILAYLILTKQLSLIKKMQLGRGVLLFALIGLPWFIYQIVNNQGLLNDWFFQQTIGRIVLHHDRERFYFFIPILIGLFSPWVFFLVPALKKYLSFKGGFTDQNAQHTLLLFLWFILPFIFFSCIGKKLVPYILPLLPALAIIVGRLWDELFNDLKILSEKVFAVSYYIFFSTLGILTVATIVFLTLGFVEKLNLQPIRANITAITIILIMGMSGSLFYFKLKKPRVLFLSIALAAMSFFLVTITVLPKIEASTSKSIKALALQIKQDLKPEDKVVNYRCFLKSLPFYLGRRTIVVERERNLAYEENPASARDYLLGDKQDLYRLLSQKQFKVYCITYTWEFEQIQQEYPKPIYLLGQAGKYRLFVNQMRPKLMER
ncbi:MAG: glycosyltransferase family 39 protein [Candidatus Omnitrophica bacterium]|nr:glycosyltransferase family 39 protein [Candidatus Omnitrophota bacterium]